MDSTELNALIHLLDDPDEEVYRHVSDRLISLGTGIIPSLEKVWEESFDPQLHYRLEELIHLIQFENLLADARFWSRNRSHSLLQGALLVSRYQYPDQDEFVIKQQLDRIAHEISQEMNSQNPPLEQVNLFNQVLFTLHGFSGNTQNIHDPQHHFLKYVLESKKGNAVSLSVLYLLLAQKVELPVYGVNLPQHFILSYHKNFLNDASSEHLVRNSLLFYINPFNKGVIFNREDINYYLRKLHITPTPSHFVPCSNREIIEALLGSLMVSYELAGVADKVRELSRLREALSESPSGSHRESEQ